MIFFDAAYHAAVAIDAVVAAVHFRQLKPCPEGFGCALAYDTMNRDPIYFAQPVPSLMRRGHYDVSQIAVHKLTLRQWRPTASWECPTMSMCGQRR